MRKLVSRVAARIAQESLGLEERELASGGRSIPRTATFSLGQHDAALGVGGPLSGVLPDLLLPPTAAEMMSYPTTNSSRAGW